MTDAADRVAKRRRPSVRRLRHAVARALARGLPGFARAVGFHTRFLSYDAGAEAVGRETRAVPNPLTAEDRAFVLGDGRRFETWDDPAYAARDPLTFTRETFVARDARLAAATGGLGVAAPVRALLTPDGADPGPQRNRPRLMRRRRRLAGLSVAAVPSNNVWHFYDMVALPLVAHMEGGASPRPDRLILPPRPSGAQAAALPLLAAHYGLAIETTAAADEIAGDFLLWRHVRPCTEWLDFAPEHAATLRRVLRAGFGARGGGAGGGGAARLYLDRGAGARRFRDAGALEALLARRGFVRFVAHGGNVPEQVAAFSAARVVLGAHGAGLVNLLFCEPGGALAEVLPTDLRKSTYRMLARQTGLDYRGLVATDGGFRDALGVDFAALDAALGELGG
jgi:hypothetical protein